MAKQVAPTPRDPTDRKNPWQLRSVTYADAPHEAQVWQIVVDSAYLHYVDAPAQRHFKRLHSGLHQDRETQFPHDYKWQFKWTLAGMDNGWN